MCYTLQHRSHLNEPPAIFSLSRTSGCLRRLMRPPSLPVHVSPSMHRPSTKILEEIDVYYNIYTQHTPDGYKGHKSTGHLSDKSTGCRPRDRLWFPAREPWLPETHLKHSGIPLPVALFRSTQTRSPWETVEVSVSFRCSG